MPTLVYQCPAGISGDMNLGAMVALGVKPPELVHELRKLPYTGWRLAFESDKRKGMSGIRCDVILEKEDASSDDHHENHHHHDHGHDHHGHHHHRTFKEIREAIETSKLSDFVKEHSVKCFKVLAEAEGTVHGIDPETVHFHEVGAIDSIVDMVGAAICWELLGVDRILCSSLEVGGGTVKCAHGRMPVPAPATANLLLDKPYTSGATDKETTTPTGAALLVGVGAEFSGKTNGRQVAAAIGVGQRDDPNLANVLYVSLIDESAGTATADSDTVMELAANLDDMSPEAVAFLNKSLLSSGALDVWQTAATFKKGRLGVVVHALCEPNLQPAIEAVYFKHSTTLGVRRTLWERTKLQRKETSMETPHGPVRVKSSRRPQGNLYQKYEYDDCARIAKETGMSIEDVHRMLDAL
ncbi:MAG: nickel pincer cofactor biosynthesis protein LarC [Verrucomicrobiota bacterium]